MTSTINAKRLGELVAHYCQLSVDPVCHEEIQAIMDGFVDLENRLQYLEQEKTREFLKKANLPPMI